MKATYSVENSSFWGAKKRIHVFWGAKKRIHAFLGAKNHPLSYPGIVSRYKVVINELSRPSFDSQRLGKSRTYDGSRQVVRTFESKGAVD